jgi:Skp family chaperone for outer membrane proteins
MAHNVFISHSSQDKPVADAVCAALERASIRCWIAPRDVQPGRSFAGEITRAIQRSKVMVLIFSAHTNASEQVLREVQLAANSHLHIVQFRIQDVIPNDDLEYYLSTPHWLDALTPPLESHLDRLETSVKALLDMARPEPTIPVKPTEATPSQAVLPPITSVLPERTKVSSPKRTQWIAAAAIALFVISAAVFLLAWLPRLRHTATPSNASVATTPTPSSSAGQSASVTSSATPTAAAAAALPASGRAGELGRNPSFAFVDMNRIFKEYRKTKEAETKINEAKNAAKKEFDVRADAYKGAIEEINNLNKQLDAPALSANVKTQKAKERDGKIANVKAMEREINEFRKTREKELQDQAWRLRSEIVRDITGKINELDRSGNDFILDSSGQSLNGVPVLMFAPANADMSERVISALNGTTSRTFLVTHDIAAAAVDMNEVFKQFNKTKSAESKINEARNAARKEYDDRTAEHTAAIAEINNLNKELDARALSANVKTQILRARDDKIANVKKMESEIKDFKTTREKQLQDQALAMRGGIVKEIEHFIAQQYVKGQECMVLDISGHSLNGVPWVVYARTLPNLTNEIISGLNYGSGTVESTTRSKFVSSDSLRFGMIDMDRALKALPETKQVEAEIKAAKDKATAELGDHPDAAAQTAKDQELQSQAADKRRPFVDRIVAAVAAVGRNHELDVVFDVSGQSLNGVPIAVTSRKIPDVTAEVIADLGGRE